jgi:hypothetical protein
MNRVIITRPMLGLCGMQVCAVKDATDEEILSVCNLENPSGTSNEWSIVVRNIDEDSSIGSESLPVQCEQEPDRMHFIVIC